MLDHQFLKIMIWAKAHLAVTLVFVKILLGFLLVSDFAASRVL